MRDRAKSPAEIVADANALARTFYRMHGYAVPKGYRFDKAHHPQERGMWNMVVAAYEFIEGTDVVDALTMLDDEANDA